MVSEAEKVHMCDLGKLWGKEYVRFFFAKFKIFICFYVLKLYSLENRRILEVYLSSVSGKWGG